MSWSANEVQALATKAARGAGAPAGQAAAFGRAAVCHLTGARAPDDLATALDALPEGPILAIPLALTALVEQATGDVVTGVLPSECPALAQSYVDALPYVQTARGTANGLEVSLQLTTPAPRAPLRRLNLPDTLAALMTELAARTFVPESEASRLAGAGAGLTDND